MKRAERALASAVTAVLAGVGLVLTGCGVEQESVMNSDKARDQLDGAVEAVQSATGTDWEVVVEPGVVGCSQTHGRWVTTWEGTPTSSRDAAFADVAAVLTEEGFLTSTNGPDTSAPVLLAHTGDGFGLAFSQPVEGGPIGFGIGTDCFREEAD
jgi:hypothetical protein